MAETFAPETLEKMKPVIVLGFVCACGGWSFMYALFWICVGAWCMQKYPARMHTIVAPFERSLRHAMALANNIKVEVRHQQPAPAGIKVEENDPTLNHIELRKPTPPATAPSLS